MKKSAVTRIVIYSVLIALLAGLLGTALAFHHQFGWHGIRRIIGGEMDMEFDSDGTEIIRADQGQKISLEAASVREIQVEWVAGDVQILPGDTAGIEIQETASEKPLVYSLREGKLKIQFCEETIGMKFGVNLRMPSKDLTITVPADWAGQELEIHSVSADVEVRELSLEEVEFQGVSGRFDLKNCKINELSMETVSGKVTMDGQVQKVDCESVSADCELVLANVPREISMEGVSGRLELTLPADAGFTVEMDGLSKDLDTDFAVTSENGKFIAGDGGCRIDIDGVSGNAKIYQAK